MTRCKRCQHALSMTEREIHVCINKLWVITMASYAVACGPTLEQALWDEQRWLNKMHRAGLLDTQPSARA